MPASPPSSAERAGSGFVLVPKLCDTDALDAFYRVLNSGSRCEEVTIRAINAYVEAAATPVDRNASAPERGTTDAPAWFPHPKTPLDKMAVALLAEFQRVEPEHAISRHPVSWVATFVDLARVALAAAQRPPVREGLERVRHLKRGTEYEVLCRGAEVQIASRRGGDGNLIPKLYEGDRVIVYRDDDGKLWACEEDEFRDGCFETIARPATDPAPGDQGASLPAEPAPPVSTDEGGAGA